jgi:glutaredoxin-like protein NrdH
VNDGEVRLFIKPYCGWCTQAMTWLDKHGVDYEVLDVMADSAAYQEMVRLSGQDMAPVLEAGGKVLADFGPEELPGFWKELKKP